MNLRPEMILIAILAIGALAFGGFAIATDMISFGGTVQVSAAEGSAVAATDDQIAQLAFAFMMIVVFVVGVGLGIASLVWLASSEVTKAEDLEPAPVVFSLTSGEPNSLGSMVVKNSVPLLATMAVGLVAVFVVIAVLLGAV